MRKIKAVIFDMDGVLVDAKEWHYESLNRALNLFGFNINREDHLSTYDGLPTKMKLAMLTEKKGLDKNLHSVINDLKQMYTLDLVEAYCKPNEEHLQALANLKLNGFLLGVASNSVRKSVEVMMEKTRLAPFLDTLLSNEDVENPKPAPDIYLAAAKNLGLAPQECLVVEDNKNGIASAKAAGTNLMEVQSICDVNYQNILDHLQRYERLIA